jgi:hypothetical protein
MESFIMGNAQSPRRSSAAILAVAGLSTVSLGLALVGMLRPSPAPVEVRPAALASAPASADAVGARSPDRERVRRLERRVAELSEAAEPSDPGAAPAAAAMEEADPEADKREAIAWWDGLKDAHEQESRDPAWAGGAEDLFRTELTAIAEGRGFEVVSLDCRQSSCTAALEWPSYTADEVHRDTRAVMHHRFQQNCGITLAAPPPEDPSAPYRAEIILHCAAHRARVARR